MENISGRDLQNYRVSLWVIYNYINIINFVKNTQNTFILFDRYKRQTHSVEVYNSTIPTWLNVTLTKEDLDEWSRINDFNLKDNVVKMEDYKSKELFLSNLADLEKSLSSVAELVINSHNTDTSDSSVIQFKVTKNVRKLPLYLKIVNSNICLFLTHRLDRLMNTSSK